MGYEQFNKTSQEKISITMDEDLYEQLKVIADEDGRNVSNYINLTMRRHVRSLTDKASEKDVSEK